MKTGAISETLFTSECHIGLPSLEKYRTKFWFWYQSSTIACDVQNHVVEEPVNFHKLWGS